MKFFRVIFLSFILLLMLGSTAVFAKNQKFVSIEPHLGFGGLKEFYIGGKIYNYEGVEWTRSPYYLRPAITLNFQGDKIDFTPDSEGYFWVKVPVKSSYNLNYGYENLNQVSLSLDKHQDRKNKNLILVTNFGLNAKEIQVPFIMPDPESKFGIISDFDNTITRVRGLGLIEFITTNPDIFKLREGIIDTYQKLVNGVNPIFYVTARPNGTYQVVKTILEQNNLPLGPILARDLGFWFLNKGLSIKDHKMQSIENILNTLSDKRFILIGDNSRSDEKIYIKIKEKYPKRIIKIFIFNNKRKKPDDTEDVIFIENPREIISRLQQLGLLD